MKIDNIIIDNISNLKANSIHLKKVKEVELDEYLEISQPKILKDYGEGFFTMYQDQNYQVYVVCDVEINQISLFRNLTGANQFYNELVNEFLGNQISIRYPECKDKFEKKFTLNVSKQTTIKNLSKLLDMNPSALDLSLIHI